MNLTVQREQSANGATIGVLSVDGEFECFTLEDEIREVAGQPVSAWKVPDETAIPAGRYRVIMSHSNRFQCLLPEVLSVPGFTFIRIHAGNNPVDTHGCLLVGQSRGIGTIGTSRAALDNLIAKLEQIAVGEEVWITYLNPERPVT